MRTWLKALLALALVLPLGAFVAGSLVASAADDPAPRDTVFIDDTDRFPSPSGSPKPSVDPEDDDDPEGVTPGYGDVDDDDDSQSGRGGGDDDDDEGRDGGDDDDDGRGGGDD